MMGDPKIEPSIPAAAAKAAGTGLSKHHWLQIASFACAGAALTAVLLLHLLGGLLAGLLVYQIVQTLAPPLARRLSDRRAKLVAVFLLSVFIVGTLSGVIILAVEHFRQDVPSIQRMSGQLLQFTDQIRERLPESLSDYFPDDTEDLREEASAWISSHLGMIQIAGHAALRAFAHIVIGMILGAFIAIGSIRKIPQRPLAAALATRAYRFSESFRRIVFAQVKISLVNSTFTAIYLLIALPQFHARLPLSKSLITLTFVVGLLPVIGNLISNTVIVLVSLSVSLPVAIASLVFLVLVHKFEYFLNARIVGGEIEARAWELLLAMLVMEAAFGIPGVIAAPIFYAYIKRELLAAKLV
jgi:predicted PurR-regulated permease PerM